MAKGLFSKFVETGRLLNEANGDQGKLENIIDTIVEAELNNWSNIGPGDFVDEVDAEINKKWNNMVRSKSFRKELSDLFLKYLQ